MEELKIVAVITAKEEFKDEVVASLHAVVDGTHTEEGNVSYELHQDVDNSLNYVMIEVWKSQEAINSHNGSAHFQKFVADTEGKLSSINVVVMKKVY